MLIGHKGMGDNMSALRLAKKELRRSIRQTISSLSDESINSQCRYKSTSRHAVWLMRCFATASAVTKSILSLPEYQRARSLSVYLSMPKGEISTSLIVKDALRRGKHVFVPYVHKVAQAVPESPGSVMDMVSLHSLEDYETLEHDSWGIPTPSETSIGRRKCCLDHPETTDSEIKEPADGNVELIIMPGMAFDKGLGRLGHGKGYYDFFLHRYHEKKVSIDSSNDHMPFLSKNFRT